MLKPGLDVEFRRPSPSPRRIHRRFLLLAAIACRSELAAHAGDTSAREIDRSVGAWLADEQLSQEAEPRDREWLSAPLERLSEGTGLAATEGAAVLAWALGEARLAALDAETDLHTIAGPLGWLQENWAERSESLRWRARTDWLRLAELLDVAQYMLERAGAPMRLTHFSPDRLQPPADADPLPIGPSGELRWADPVRPLEGVAASDRIRWRLVARRRALGWVLGQSTDYHTADL